MWPVLHPENKDAAVNFHPLRYSDQFGNVRMLMTKVLLAESQPRDSGRGNCHRMWVSLLCSFFFVAICFKILFAPLSLFNEISPHANSFIVPSGGGGGGAAEAHRRTRMQGSSYLSKLQSS